MPSVHAIVPAAGVGKRFGGDTPKQYLQLSGKTVLFHSVNCLVTHPRIEKVVVATAAEDTRCDEVFAALDSKVLQVNGGAERAHSVLAGLAGLLDHAHASDWVLVHDAARPCLLHADIDNLIDTLIDHPVGGILAAPVRDTLKRCDGENTIVETVPREGMWQAQTPQMFRLGVLHGAIADALAGNLIVTDEAQAMERCGFTPRVVAASNENIKITRPGDLEIAEQVMRSTHQD